MITWRRLTAEDFPLVARWLATPHVHRWWYHEFTPEAVERDFGASARGEEPGEDWLVSVDGEPVALMQRSRIADYQEDLDALSAVVPVPDDAVTLDYLIGDLGQVGRGLGSRLIRWAVERTWADHPRAPAIIIPVVAANIASWRALEKAGARRIAEADLEPENPIDEAAHYVYRFDRPPG
ncbi:acetyltransferase [Allokutzneria sp. A3M-2-11 16]|uniref:GNAT family N-acetyltransferase n=1 Tax=Allokutzneria sp. A3M-2-11 16 TaxID=2962043 RepID=UPI0020B6B1D8|nr:GNAT family N-acetyltransferase [Allokutzneria sp. A3M-2-11 16]MCP3805114.1 acetyltransferase [Allokutzneria sp. A3M-2-11 16]